MYRIEYDTLGEVRVPNDKYWGAQTQRSIENFCAGEKMPMEVIYAFAKLKKACAIANFRLNKLSETKKNLIVVVCDEIIEKKLDDNFPLRVMQTGSGTQTNMNINEVIVNRAHVINGGKITDKEKILHPNDDVNMCQSSNDTFPSVMNIIAGEMALQVLESLKKLHSELNNKAKEFHEIIKIGRTHLMDATPIRLGQEFSGYASLISKVIKSLEIILAKRDDTANIELAIGGTAVGTGINAAKNFDKYVCEELNKMSNIKYRVSDNNFETLSTNNTIIKIHGTYKELGLYLMKICNDIRFMASGPRCGLSELILPANEPGSSIMPGKVNPTQIEALTMIAAEVIGNDTTINIGEMNSQFELNTYRPLIIKNFIESSSLLTIGINSFIKKMLKGTKANIEKINFYSNNSLMLVTALSPKIGYENAAKIAHKAFEENISLRKAAISLNLLTEEEFTELINLKKLV